MKEIILFLIALLALLVSSGQDVTVQPEPTFTLNEPVQENYPIAEPGTFDSPLPIPSPAPPPTAYPPPATVPVPTATRPFTAVILTPPVLVSTATIGFNQVIPEIAVTLQPRPGEGK